MWKPLETCAPKNLTYRTWLSKKIFTHRETDDGPLDLKIKLDGDYAPIWEPRRTFLEEAVSLYLLLLLQNPLNLAHLPALVSHDL